MTSYIIDKKSKRLDIDFKESKNDTHQKWCQFLQCDDLLTDVKYYKGYVIDTNSQMNSVSETFDIFKFFDIKPTDNFLDLGSGVGLMCFAASKYNFNMVYGIEYNKISYDCSLKNLKKLKLNNVKFILDDFFKYDIPQTITHIFTYNPFGHTINLFKKMFERLKNCNTGTYIVIYNVRFNSDKYKILEDNKFELIKYEQNKICGITHYYYIIIKKSS